MTFLKIVLLAIHIFCAAFWLFVLLFWIFFFLPKWSRYQEYVYFANFREELFAFFWRYLNLSLVLIFISGAGLVGFLGKNSWDGYFGLFFSLKMLLLLGLFLLIQPHLRHGAEYEQPKFFYSLFYRVLVLLTSFLLVFFSVILRLF